MSQIKYFFQFIFIFSLFIIFKLIGLKLASNLSSKIISLLGPLFRSKNLINSNLLRAFPNLKQNEINKISKEMWGNYGRILSEYIFIKSIKINYPSHCLQMVWVIFLKQYKRHMTSTTRIYPWMNCPYCTRKNTIPL